VDGGCGGNGVKVLALSTLVVSGKVFNTQKTNEKIDGRGVITPHTSTTCKCTRNSQLVSGRGFRGNNVRPRDLRGFSTAAYCCCCCLLEKKNTSQFSGVSLGWLFHSRPEASTGIEGGFLLGLGVNMGNFVHQLVTTTDLGHFACYLAIEIFSPLLPPSPLHPKFYRR
jgi:hypothetical protein